MTGRAVLAAVLLLAAGCAGVPPLTPVGPETAERLRAECPAVYPTGRWELVHSVIATPPGGGRRVAMGALAVDAGAATLRLSMMTPEGFVLVDAGWADGRTEIHRAVPPFDDPALVEGIVADLRLLSFPPAPAPDRIGRTQAGAARCRYRPGPGETVDVIPLPDGWEIRRYHDGRPHRTIRATGLDDQIPRTVVLTGHGPLGYRLRLTLVSARQVPAGTPPPTP